MVKKMFTDKITIKGIRDRTKTLDEEERIGRKTPSLRHLKEYGGEEID